jgi:hypothetical protein
VDELTGLLHRDATLHPAPDGSYAPWALIVLEIEGDRISHWNSFLDTAELFPRFGLPEFLPPDR